nr:RNA-directed DNA polymerase, eukaryota [Tanacetum cinerariifolium]
MEGLHVAMEDAMSAGLYNCFRINTLNLSHLFFADDALFIGELSNTNIKSLVSILDCFTKSLVSRLTSTNPTFLVSGCLLLKLFRVIGTYFFSLFPMPLAVNMKLESIRSNFFWGSDGNIKKIPWISWKLALASNAKEGLGTSSLKTQFLRLFRLALNKDALNMALNDSEDVWVWSSGNSAFTDKDARGKIDDGFLPDDGFETRWNRFLPKKVNIFISRVLRDRLPSRWNLSRRGIEVASITCPTCDNGIDTSYHTMWVCSLATTVWNRVFIWLDLSPPDFPSLRGLFSWLDDLHISSSKKDIIEFVCGVVLWSLWNLRNDMMFGDTHPSRSTLFDKIVDFSFRWYSSRNKLSSISWNNWIQNPIE